MTLGVLDAGFVNRKPKAVFFGRVFRLLSQTETETGILVPNRLFSVVFSPAPYTNNAYGMYGNPVVYCEEVD